MIAAPPPSLRKPFARVGALGGLGVHFTPSELRRIFNGLARAAQVESLVTRSITGHTADRMREHYSTVTPVERKSIGRLLKLVKPADDASRGGAPALAGGAPTGEATL